VTLGPASGDADGYAMVSPDAETTPMPVILAKRPQASQDPAAPAQPSKLASSRSPAPEPRMRGPFEPAQKNAAASPPPPSEAPPVPPSASSAAGTPMSQAGGSDVWTPVSAKMDQIKDLYLTAEAIGEDALDRHFQQVSERQRQLIKEYFKQAVPGPAENSDAER
jgi:hypothetical protein